MNMKEKALQRRNSFLLVLAAFIWGIAFVAQSEGGKFGPYTFNGIRFLLGAAVLCPVLLIMSKKNPDHKEPSPKSRKALITGGIACGIFLGFASTLQQLALFYGATAGKAGFLTTCYILIVPIIGLFLGKKCGWNIWIGIGLALIGLYLLCMKGSFSLQLPDLLLLLCALGFSFHILCVDHFSPLVDGILANECCISMKNAGIRETIPAALISLLYAGILSSGAGYTLQVVGQKGINPTIASLLMSLESVFSVLGGWIILHERMNGRELFGCALIFAAVILAQIPLEAFRRKSSTQ